MPLGVVATEGRGGTIASAWPKTYPPTVLFLIMGVSYIIRIELVYSSSIYTSRISNILDTRNCSVLYCKVNRVVAGPATLACFLLFGCQDVVSGAEKQSHNLPVPFMSDGFSFGLPRIRGRLLMGQAPTLAQNQIGRCSKQWRHISGRAC